VSRALIVALLFGVVRLILPLGSAGEGSETLIAFGFLILAAYTVGEVAPTLGLPKVVGYLFAGVLFGPDLLGAVSHEGVVSLTPVSQLAISLIAFLAGSELRWEEVRSNGVVLVKVMTTELACTFVAVGGVVYLLARNTPILESAGPAEALAFALLFASIAIVHSPSVTMALLSETGARGPVARTTLGVVLLADVAVVLVFSAAAWIARALVPAAEGSEAAGVGLLIWEIGGALVVGTLLGLGVVLYLSFVARELFLFAILAAFFGAEIARLAHVETLLTLLTAGFVTENLARPARAEALRHAMERSAAPVFVVFFALSGTKIDPGAFAEVGVLVVPIALARAIGIAAGTRLGARWARVPGDVGNRVWMGLVSQAGVALGLAAIVADSFPRLGAALRLLVFPLIAVNETVGPILFRRALQQAGEVPEPGERVSAPARAPSH
jgi:Kef-type K+ transport system membrane component KefB